MCFGGGCLLIFKSVWFFWEGTEISLKIFAYLEGEMMKLLFFRKSGGQAPVELI